MSEKYIAKIYGVIETDEFDFELDEETLECGVCMSIRNMNSVVIIPREYKGLRITRIAFEGFVDCDFVESITIPNTIKTIENDAFFGCNNLSDIIYEGTIDEWMMISKGEYWNEGMQAKIVHCTDGDVKI